MNKRRIILLAAVVVLAAAVIGMQVSSAQSVKWNSDFNTAAKAAEAANKPLMVDFYTDWCHWCKKLDQTTYVDAKVVKLSGDFVCVKLNAEKNRDVATRYKIAGYPTIIFLNSKAKEISRVTGYQDANDFLKSMQQALKNAK